MIVNAKDTLNIFSSLSLLSKFHNFAKFEAIKRKTIFT